ncbi:hypothetical protein Z517_11553 [Fonsecaea pedrosoi CBS 271.37]|uniref:Major facilitator superfamily (MFS) profile domain-containing protein n=1 Tax=Fonsecaea pedrosoi CBS 271.37 TaxID=1442368 RepID=A0A0D2G1V3_9EURO|nr:uncharacterized protein Z517_11553 [Fonsecaea pedrosoi CBS 271.37]KIW74783.1 hypothetical protein Z517_11553 [Fonsecaea pedrosoi CBS 271.37]
MADIKEVSAHEVEAPKTAEVSAPDQLADFDPEYAAKVRHRIDWRLLTALGPMYAICLLDRSNLASAAIAGMTEDLDMVKGNGYNLTNMCFFITYILFQPLMVVVCRRMGPRWFLPLICFLWGCLLIGIGFVHDWQTMLGLRLIFGVLESGYFPGCLYLLSTWYTRFESARRYSIFYLIGSCASGCSGILAYGLMQADGAGGLQGWRWIFILEGLITVTLAMIAVVMMVKFPDEEMTKPSPKFLTKEELNFVTARLNADRADVSLEPFAIKRFLEPATEWYIYGFPLLLMLVTTLAYAFAFTLPTVLRSTLGFGLAESQCLTAPPYFFAAVFMYIAGWYSDKYHTRGPVLVTLALVSLAGLPIMGWAKNPWVRYFGVFVTVAGANSAIPSIMAYQGTNIRGQWRRAFCSAALTAIGGIGGIIGSLIFRSQDAPNYYPGFIACIVACILVIVIVAIMSVYFHRCNKAADRGERILLGDPNFRFTL